MRNWVPVFVACALALPLPAAAIGTTLTYQGSLEDAGAPAQGSYDLEFQLLTAAEAPIGAPIVVEDVAVVRGVFTVALDFGGAAFDGSDRRLRIGVRPGASVAAFTPLLPTTLLTATPYAQVATVAEVAASIADNIVTGSKLALPLARTHSDAGPLLSLTNAAAGAGVRGTNSSTNSSVVGVHGMISSVAPGGFSAGVRGENAGTSGLGVGVYGSHQGSGWGVYGVTPNGLGVYGNSSGAGIGVYANSNTGTGLTALSNNGSPATIAIYNNANNNTVLNVSTVGNGSGISVTGSGNGAGVVASTGAGFGLHGITSAQTSAGVIGDNNGGGEAVVGRTTSNISAAVVGRNDGGGSGVRGFIATNSSGTGAGVLGQVGSNSSTGNAGRFENLNGSNAEPVLRVSSNAAGALAVFRAGAPNANVIRFTAAGRGIFNDGTQVGGADLAEVVPLDGVPEPGDVVEIDPVTPNRFRLSTSAHNSRVAGVISTDPGMTLNSPTAEESRVADSPALALAGRVPVKASAENGPIAPGDLLVSASRAGHAMRAPPFPAPGTVIGKALEPLRQGVGSIEMLVMLR